MNIVVEHSSGEIKILVHGPKDDPDLIRILTLLQEDQGKLWCRNENTELVAVSTDSIVWAESVDSKTFIYTQDSVYETSLSLGELTGKLEMAGLFRCAKSTVINLNKVRSLKSCAGSRIELLLQTGERVIVSRHYSPLLRERIQED